MNNTTVTSQGGDQYLVEIDGEARNIDMDGVTVVSDEDYNKLEEAGLDADYFFAPMHATNKHNLAAFEHVLRQSEFDCDDYIESKK